MALGSLVPGMPAMAIPQMQDNSLGTQGMSILKAALAQQQKSPMGGAPQQPPVGQSAGPGMPMQIAPPATGAPGLLGALMAKLGGQGGQPNMGGAGPAPTALTGLW